jgi:ABC-type multidrug transport system fused ATPase/permease subunit
LDTPSEEVRNMTVDLRLRIAIAWTFLKNAPLLLIDEPSSTLEAKSSKVVNGAVDQLIVGNQITVVVARRLAMLQRVDVVAMLHDGQIEEQGRHDEQVWVVCTLDAASIQLNLTATWTILRNEKF